MMNTYFPNRAGCAVDENDSVLSQELIVCGIVPYIHDLNLRTAGEVKTRVIGTHLSWTFTRCWRYWAASGPGIPCDVAELLHAAHGSVVRVNGHCGSPSPTHENQGFAIGVYHVDSSEGLSALVHTLNYVAAQATGVPKVYCAQDFVRQVLTVPSDLKSELESGISKGAIVLHQVAFYVEAPDEDLNRHSPMIALHEAIIGAWNSLVEGTDVRWITAFILASSKPDALRIARTRWPVGDIRYHQTTDPSVFGNPASKSDVKAHFKSGYGRFKLEAFWIKQRVKWALPLLLAKVWQ